MAEFAAQYEGPGTWTYKGASAGDVPAQYLTDEDPPAPPPETPPPLPTFSSPLSFTASTAEASALAYGTDISTFPDLDPTFTLITGERVVAESIARRWTTPPGSLEGEEDYGYDVRLHLNQALSPRDLFRIQSVLTQEAEKEERVEGVDVTVDHNFSSGTLKVVGAIQTNDVGTFDLVLAIDKVSATLLSPER